MTREEAISWLVSLTEHEGEDVPIYDDDVEALNIAIEALEHPEKNVVAVVPCGDAISRQEAIDTIRQLYLDLASQKAVIDILKVLPSVTPQKPNKSEIPTGSTTKNCRTCRNQGSHHGICEICKDNKCWTGKEPIADNNSAVDCIVDVLGSYTDLDIPYKREIAENILTKLPSVTPQEPRKGHWEHGRELSRVFIGDALRGINYEDWHCSNCHCVIEQSIKPKWNYCPNCGAKMVEPQESET